MTNQNEKNVKYLRACQLINAGVDFIALSELLGITMIQAVELMTEDDAFNRYFELKNNFAVSE